MDTKQFLTSKWMEKARKYAANPKKLKLLLVQLGAYISKDGLSNVKENLLLMYHYLQDIVSGRYKAYNSSKLLIVSLRLNARHASYRIIGRFVINSLGFKGSCR